MLTHLIPVYNTRARHLIECVHSIRSQDAHPILIIDDGSTSPETFGALEMLKVIVPDVKVYEMPENLGTPAALNIGHALIDTKYVALMGSSDIALPGKYKLQLELLQKWPTIDVLGTSLMAFRDTDPFRHKMFTLEHKDQPKPKDKKGHDPYFLCNHGTVIYRNEAVKKVGGYNEKYRRAQDVELWSRMWANGAIFRNINKVLYLWRR